MADELRHDIVDILMENKDMLSERVRSLPFLLDREVGKSYSSIDDRLTKMAMPSEFAGHLEFFAASVILSRQIHVYTETAQGYEVYAKFPNDVGHNDCERPAITILYRPDTQTSDGHFDVVCKPSTLDWLKSDSMRNIISANNALSFSEIFAQWQFVEFDTTVNIQSVAIAQVGLELTNIEEQSEFKSDCVVSESAPLIALHTSTRPELEILAESEPKADGVVSQSAPIAPLASTQPEPDMSAEPTQMKQSVKKQKQRNHCRHNLDQAKIINFLQCLDAAVKVNGLQAMTGCITVSLMITFYVIHVLQRLRQVK